MIAHAEMPGKILQRLAVPLHGEAAMQAQRFGSGAAGHVRVAVAVAAHPRSETKPARRRFNGRVE